jgi:hypothetical protein
VGAHMLLRQEGGPLTFGQCGRKTEVRSRLWRERQSLVKGLILSANQCL